MPLYLVNGTFIDPTKFLCFPVSKIHRKMELYVLQEFAIWLLLLVNVHLFFTKLLRNSFFSTPSISSYKRYNLVYIS